MPKKILFVAPIGNGGPSELYKKLAPLLREKYSDEYEVELSNSLSGWIRAHFLGRKYDIIISVLPFLWKPCEKFVLNIHGDYRVERGVRNAGSLMAYLYPYTELFADALLYPSEYLRNILKSRNKNQYVIGNMCPFPLRENPKELTEEKQEYNLITITNWNNSDKASAILSLAETLSNGDFGERKLLWRIIGGGHEKYQEILEKVLEKQGNIKIELLGFLANKDIQDALSSADIFLYATHRETFGIAILEAASQGLPLVLVKHEAFLGIWNDTGIFRAENILQDITHLLEDAEYYRFRSGASLTDAKKFAKEEILHLWKGFLETSKTNS